MRGAGAGYGVRGVGDVSLITLTRLSTRNCREQGTAQRPSLLVLLCLTRLQCGIKALHSSHAARYGCTPAVLFNQDSLH